MITICRIVVYTLSAGDAEKINRRRTNGGSIAERLAGANPTWPEGAQAHIGNEVSGGESFPAIVVKVWPDSFGDNDPLIDLQVFLDGSDVYWAQKVSPDHNGAPKPGTWHWSAR